MFHSKIKHFVIFSRLAIVVGQILKSKNRSTKLKDKFLWTFGLTMVLVCQNYLACPVFSKVVRIDQVDLSGKHYPYLYQWSDSDIKPTAVILAIHGITMHGLTYERLAHHLAKEGAIVFSPDLTGCGRRYKKDAVSHLKSAEELKDIAQSLRDTYKNLPIICLGESLGANLALVTAESAPGAVDGIILSSPALKRRVNVSPKIVVGSMNMLVGLVKSDNLVDLSPYVRAYASEDPIIVQAMLNDPLMHRQVSTQELLDSFDAMRNVVKRSKLVRKDTPVLIIQGSQDRILKADAIIKLISNLGSEDQTVKWLNHRGHVILEECEPPSDVLQTIDDWFKTHIHKSVANMDNSDSVTSSSSMPPPVLQQATLNLSIHSHSKLLSSQ